MRFLIAGLIILAAASARAQTTITPAANGWYIVNTPQGIGTIGPVGHSWQYTPPPAPYGYPPPTYYIPNTGSAFLNGYIQGRSLRW